MRRHRFQHRAAYAPRLWPQLAVSLVLAVGLSFVVVSLGGGPVEGFLGGAGIGFLVNQVRWAVWRRNHPVRPFELRQHEVRRDT